MAERRRNLIFGLLTLVVVYLLLETLAASGLWALARFRDLRYEPTPVEGLRPRHIQVMKGMIADAGGFIRLDSELGWAPRPSGIWREYRISPQGLRDDRTYGPTPTPGRPRIAAFGDSFTFGADTKNVYAFASQMARLEPGIEVLNFGVPAYGLGQAYLRHRREATSYAPDVVLIGFMTENVFRVVNRFRPFYYAGTASPLAKPRFALRDGDLEVIENPLPTPESYEALLRDPENVLQQIGKGDYYFERALRDGPFDLLPSVRLVKLLGHHFGTEERVIQKGHFNTESEPYQVTVKIFDAFWNDVDASGAIPIIVLFPSKGDLSLHRRRDHRRYEPLIDDFEAKGYRYVDLLDCFARRAGDVELEELVLAHYRAIGNYHVAHCLLDELRSLDLIPPLGASPAGTTAAMLQEQRDAAIDEYAAFPSMQDISKKEREGILEQIGEAYDVKIRALESTATADDRTGGGS